MLTLVLTVLTASLLGSLHCAGMCGPFVALAVGGCGEASPQVTASRRLLPGRFANHVAYHCGRLFTYLVFGLIAGLVGAALNLGGSLVGIQRAAAVLAGVMMVVMGGVALARLGGWSGLRWRAPIGLEKLLASAHQRIAALPAWPRAGAFGLLTTLLPCGWLYAFVITASGTGSPALAALTMAVFWVGTLPVLVTLGAGLQALTGSLRRRIPLITSLALIVVGLLTVFGRLHTPAMALHSVATRPASVQDAISKAAELPTKEMPCCREEGK
ncbi:MAG: sulfite exporter TauE/SafE family protein [Planctomycetes bacterium]|nr:sulfite exporter TauE/SafE family protein [Planctomycetota bacterium]